MSNDPFQPHLHLCQTIQMALLSHKSSPNLFTKWNTFDFVPKAFKYCHPPYLQMTFHNPPTPFIILHFRLDTSALLNNEMFFIPSPPLSFGSPFEKSSYLHDKIFDVVFVLNKFLFCDESSIK